MKRIEKLITNVANYFETHYKIMALLTMTMYFLRSLMSGLIKGGRWDLYQNIAMADRFLNGQGLYYSAIEASSPYFPGVAFLSIFIGKFFYPWRDYILLVIASLIGTAFLYALVKLGGRFSNNRSLSLIVTFTLVSTGFESYRSYMNEFKADSLILLYAIFIVLIIDKIEKDEWKAGIGPFMGLFVLAFFMDVTKQQALYIDIALGIYLVFTKRLIFKEKIIVLGSLIIAGLLDLAVIFCIPGVEILTIKNLSAMPYWDIKSIILQMKADFKGNIIYFVLLFLFVYLLIKKRVRLNTLAWKWLAIAFVFGMGQIVGGWKTGGNAGNYEAGMISFLPFVVIAAEYIFREYFVDEKKKILMGIMNYAICWGCLVIAAWMESRFDMLASKLQTDREVSAYLSQTFGDETVMYYSDQYMQLARSTVKPGMDMYTVPRNMKEYMHTREEYLENQVYKYLYVDTGNFKSWDEKSMIYFGEKVDEQGMLEKYYEEIDDPNMPESLKGRLFVAK